MSMENLNSSDGTVSQAALGERRWIKGAQWVYGKAAANMTQVGSLVYFLNDGTFALATPALLTATKPTMCGVIQFTFASGEYGWVPVGPWFLREDDVTPFKVYSKIAAINVAMYAVAATPGEVDDAVAAPMVHGLILTTAVVVDDTLGSCIALCPLGANLYAAVNT